VPVIPVHWRLKQENPKFKVNLGYIARPYFKKEKLRPVL
jgi:hypothetical protein